MKNIGLLMTYNESDIVAEMMESNRKFFDHIYVMDGSTDNTAEILKTFDNVSYLIKDQDLVPKRKIFDGARQFLLEKIQEDHGAQGWITLMHGDEIFVDDPNEIALRAEKSGAEIVNWHSLNFFLHTSQKDTFDESKSIQDQVIFYQPGFLEIRQFRNKPGIYYNLNSNKCVFPHGLKQRTLFDFPVLKHYPHRSKQQLVNKPKKGFPSIREKEKVKKIELFTDQYTKNLKQVRKYEGDFGEFQPGKRPNFLWQWLTWYRYK